MMASMLLLCAAGAALVAATASLVTIAGLAAGRSFIASCSPSDQARIYLAAALAPLLITVAVMVAALAPSFGWIADHCMPARDLHGHPHLCVHHEVAVPALPIIIVAALFALRCAVVTARVLWLSLGASSAKKRLLQQSRMSEVGARLLPLDRPQAFVIGIHRPILFVTQGLLAPAYRRYLDVVLAHERAHVERRDPRRRLMASLAFAFHLPGAARFIEKRLARAHEMAADDQAARAVGSRAGVAQALIGLARAHTRLPRAAHAFSQCDVEARVQALLGPTARLHGPGMTGMTLAALLLCLIIAGGAHAVHHGIEVALGVLG